MAGFPKSEDHPQEKEMQKSKMAVWGGLTNSCEKKRSEKQRRKGKIFPFECRVPKTSKEMYHLDENNLKNLDNHEISTFYSRPIAE